MKAFYLFIPILIRKEMSGCFNEASEEAVQREGPEQSAESLLHALCSLCHGGCKGQALPGVGAWQAALGVPAEHCVVLPLRRVSQRWLVGTRTAFHAESWRYWEGGQPVCSPLLGSLSVRGHWSISFPFFFGGGSSSWC